MSWYDGKKMFLRLKDVVIESPPSLQQITLEGPSIHKLYDLIMGLYNRDNLGLAYVKGKPMAVEKTCSWCVKGEDGLSECAEEHFGKAMYGCGDWQGKR